MIIVMIILSWIIFFCFGLLIGLLREKKSLKEIQRLLNEK